MDIVRIGHQPKDRRSIIGCIRNPPCVRNDHPIFHCHGPRSRFPISIDTGIGDLSLHQIVCKVSFLHRLFRPVSGHTFIVIVSALSGAVHDAIRPRTDGIIVADSLVQRNRLKGHTLARRLTVLKIAVEDGSRTLKHKAVAIRLVLHHAAGMRISPLGVDRRGIRKAPLTIVRRGIQTRLIRQLSKKQILKCRIILVQYSRSALQIIGVHLPLQQI